MTSIKSILIIAIVLTIFNIIVPLPFNIIFAIAIVALLVLVYKNSLDISKKIVK